MVFDLATPEVSYLLGFLQADGHLGKGTGNKGRLSVELADRDSDILEKLQRLIPTYSSIRKRVRDTNFSKDYHSTVWTVCDRDVRSSLNALGLPCGRKSEVVAPPDGDFSRPDYYRGLVDGDGSLGFTDRGFPFLSFCSSSKEMTQAYLTFVTSVTGKIKYCRPTARDSMWNICVFKEDAQKLAATLYYDGCLALNRKIDLARDVRVWVRPPGMRRVSARRWTEAEDNVVRKCSVEVAMDVLGRTEKSVRVRKFRLRHALTGPYRTMDGGALLSEGEIT